MKALKILKISVFALISAMVLNLTETIFAVSSAPNSAIKDYKMEKPTHVEFIYSDIAKAVRDLYPGSRPEVTIEKSSMNTDCYHVKFKFQNELKRVSFNCSNSAIKLTKFTM